MMRSTQLGSVNGKEEENAEIVELCELCELIHEKKIEENN